MKDDAYNETKNAPAEEPRNPDNKQYVVLEHLTLPDKGFRFWTVASDDNTHSYKGDLWYKEIMFTDEPEEAIRACSNYDPANVASFAEMMAYAENKYKEDLKNAKNDNI